MLLIQVIIIPSLKFVWSTSDFIKILELSNFCIVVGHIFIATCLEGTELASSLGLASLHTYNNDMVD